MRILTRVKGLLSRLPVPDSAGTVARGVRTMNPLAIASVVSGLGSLVIAVVYTRVAGAAAYGTFQMAVAAMAIVGPLTLSASAGAATRAAAQGRAAAWPLFRRRLPYCYGAALLLAGVGAVLLVNGNGQLGMALCAAAAFVPLQLGADVYPAHLLGRRRYRSYLAYQGILQPSTAAGVSLAVVVAPDRPWLAVLAAAGITGVGQFLPLLRMRGSGIAATDDHVYARRMTGISILAAVDSRGDVLLAGSLLGPVEAGLVGVARIVPMQAKRLWEIIYQPFFVEMAGREPRDALGLATRYRGLLVLTYGGVLGVAIIVVPWLIVPVFGPEFSDAVVVTQMMLVGGILMSLGAFEAVFLRAQGLLRELGIMYSVLPVATLISLPALILALGVAGVGVKAMLAGALSSTLAIVLAHRASRAPVASAGGA